MVNYSLNLKALPLILKTDPSLIREYEHPITEILNKDFMKDIWDVENTWRGEYNAMRDFRISEIPHHFLFIKPNDMRNEFFAMAKDQILISKQPAYDMSYEILSKYHYGTPDTYIFPYNIIKRLLLPGFVKGTEMYLNGNIITAKQRALILLMQAQKQNIKTEQMEEFLAKAPEHLHNNLTGKPFSWDNKMQATYYIRDLEAPESRIYIFY
jgi:hypothetical protein